MTKKLANKLGLDPQCIKKVIRIPPERKSCIPIPSLSGLAFFREERYFFPSVGRNMGKKGKETPFFPEEMEETRKKLGIKVCYSYCITVSNYNIV